MCVCVFSMFLALEAAYPRQGNSFFFWPYEADELLCVWCGIIIGGGSRA
jgi:hypothetical protein